MSKFYKVPLYEYRNNKISKIDDVIIERGWLGVTREIVSELYIDEYRTGSSPEYAKKEVIENDMQNRGYYLFVRREDMKKANLVTPDQVREYVTTFGERPIREVVCNIYETERKIKSKIRD